LAYFVSSDGELGAARNPYGFRNGFAWEQYLEGFFEDRSSPRVTRHGFRKLA
jgi:hypothetical protein